jgi:hypothetical protein
LPPVLLPAMMVRLELPLTSTLPLT